MNQQGVIGNNSLRQKPNRTGLKLFLVLAGVLILGLVVAALGNLDAFQNSQEPVTEEASAVAEQTPSASSTRRPKSSVLTLEELSQHEIELPKYCVDYGNYTGRPIPNSGKFTDGVMDANPAIKIEDSAPVEVDGKRHLALSFNCPSETRGPNYVAVYSDSGSKVADITLEDFVVGTPLNTLTIKKLKPVDGGIQMRWNMVRLNSDGPTKTPQIATKATGEAESIFRWDGTRFVQDFDETTFYLPDGSAYKVPKVADVQGFLDGLVAGNFQQFRPQIGSSMANHIEYAGQDSVYSRLSNSTVYSCGLMNAEGVDVTNAKTLPPQSFTFGGSPLSDGKDSWMACVIGKDKTPRDDKEYGYFIFDGEQLPALYAVALL